MKGCLRGTHTWDLLLYLLLCWHQALSPYQYTPYQFLFCELNILKILAATAYLLVCTYIYVVCTYVLMLHCCLGGTYKRVYIYPSALHPTMFMYNIQDLHSTYTAKLVGCKTLVLH